MESFRCGAQSWCAVVTKLTPNQVDAWRLRRHSLIDRADRRELAKVVSSICGIQAQILPAAELAIRARVEGVHRQDVLDGLWKSHSLVKTWSMRGTLHILASSDLPLYVAALRTKLDETKLWLQKEGVTPAEVDAISEEIGKALTRQKLSREDLSREVERRTNLAPKTRRYLRSPWGVLLRPAAYQGRLAFGEGIGSKVTFVGPPKGTNPRDEPSTEQAFVTLFRRFIECYGPTTVGEFARWWGGIGDRSRSILQSTEGELEEVEFGGFRGIMLRRDAEKAGDLEAPSGVRLLPSFDCYAMHYFPRDLFVSDAHRGRIFRRTAGWNYPAVITGGKAVGVWSMSKLSHRVEVTVEAFRPLNLGERRGVEEEVTGIGEFLGSPAEVRFSAAPRRPRQTNTPSESPAALRS